MSESNEETQEESGDTSLLEISIPLDKAGESDAERLRENGMEVEQIVALNLRPNVSNILHSLKMKSEFGDSSQNQRR